MERLYDGTPDANPGMAKNDRITIFFVALVYWS